MIRVILPRHFFSGGDALSDDMIQDICRLSCNDTIFSKVCEDRGRTSWQYIKLEHNWCIKYICLSRSDLQSRNTFILQNFPSAYQHFLEDGSENKCFEYYIRYLEQPHPDYILFSYKLLITAWIRILNLSQVNPSSHSRIDNFSVRFLSLQEMRACRLRLQGRNEWNDSTVFEENDGEIALYWKTYWANWRETWAICLALARLWLWKPIVVYNVNETDSSHLARVDPANRAIMDSVWATISDCVLEIPEQELTNEEQREREVKRNTARYHYNLLQKFWDKRCYICWCNIESLIIWSHLHRFADIRNSDLSDDEKKRQITDWENGLRLCEAHDKMFEKWIIYFDWDEMKIKESITWSSRMFIDKVTFDVRSMYYANNNDENVQNREWVLIFRIKQSDYTTEMQGYLEIHRERVLRL